MHGNIYFSVLAPWHSYGATLLLYWVSSEARNVAQKPYRRLSSTSTSFNPSPLPLAEFLACLLGYRHQTSWRKSQKCSLWTTGDILTSHSWYWDCDLLDPLWFHVHFKEVYFASDFVLTQSVWPLDTWGKSTSWYQSCTLWFIIIYGF